MSADNVITAEEYREFMAAEARRGNKYGAVPVDDPLFGHFDSTGEYARWLALVALEEAGAIAALRRQVRYPLVVNGETVATYVSDFNYVEDGVEVVEDFKSPASRTPIYRLKKRLMWACHSIAIRETGR